jgi:CubicO group peptidase (beta-lactamase class C family)
MISLSRFARCSSWPDRRRHALALAAAVTLAFTAPRALAAETPDDAAGHWEGAIRLPGAQLAVLVDLARGEAGAWSGTIDIPAQGAKALPLADLTIDARNVGFTIAGVPGAPTFRGTLAASGQEITGAFTQGGGEFMFELKRQAAPADAAAQALSGFREQALAVLDALHVPGAGIAVVKNGEVVFLEGLGRRDVEAGLPVTPDTLFAIGSSTKAFTTLALATLVEEGRLGWDEPVVKHLPEFRLKDPAMTEGLTVRDLVTHRSGLPRHDLIWYRAPLKRADIVARVRHVDASARLRERWQYQNIMYVAAGLVAERLSGKTWETLVRERILAPLGMARSNFSVLDSQKDADFSQPYQWSDDAHKVERVPFQDLPEVAPAGAINSSARDMAQWLRLQLGGGAVGERRVIGATLLREMHLVHMPLSEPPLDPEFLNRGYGLGWFVEVYRGHRRVHHGGNIDGFSAQVALMPDDGLGVVVLTNGNGTPAPDVLARLAIDRLLGLPPVDWLARVQARLDAAREADKKSGKLAEQYDRKAGTRPAHALVEYEGEYEHPAYGTLRVRREGAALAADYHGIPLPLEHWHYETFRATTSDKTLSDLKLYVLFRTNTKGDVDALSLPLEPSVDDIVFVKRPPARLSDPAFLATLTGAYVLANQADVVIDVSLQGERLVAKVPGQPAYTLEPYAGTEFRLARLSGFSLRFLLDAQGRVEKALLLQPDGVYEATPKR